MPKEEPQPFDPEALIRAVLPGGHSCDPQAVADDIREWVEARAKLKIDAELEDGSKVTIEVSGEYRECKRLEAYLANLWRQIESGRRVRFALENFCAGFEADEVHDGHYRTAMDALSQTQKGATTNG